MVGLGENESEVFETIADISATGCKILTIGQYLKPGFGFMEPAEYIEPAMFEKYRVKALDQGFEMVESNPLVRSSFHAERHVKRDKK
jgi:lipoic acid synthetase